MLTTTIPARRTPAIAGLGLVVLLALTLGAGSLFAAPTAAAMEPGGQWAAQSQGSDRPLSSLPAAQSGAGVVYADGFSGYASHAYVDDGVAQPSSPAPETTVATTAAPAAAAAPTDIVSIIYAAADAYGQPRQDMLRVAMCESVLDPNAVNAAGGSYGLFQFLPGTWATTPYAAANIFDPVANANAAAWMWSVGRRGEWVCQ